MVDHLARELHFREVDQVPVVAQGLGGTFGAFFGPELPKARFVSGYRDLPSCRVCSRFPFSMCKNTGLSRSARTPFSVANQAHQDTRMFHKTTKLRLQAPRVVNSRHVPVLREALGPRGGVVGPGEFGAA